MSKASPHTLELDEAGLAAARKNLAGGAVTPSDGPWRDATVDPLNGALATRITPGAWGTAAVDPAAARGAHARLRAALVAARAADGSTSYSDVTDRPMGGCRPAS